MQTIVRRIYVLDGGTLDVEASMMVYGSDFGHRRRVPVQLFLLETTRGYILVDTGNDPGVIHDAVGTWGQELVAAARPAMSEMNHPLAQLRLLGLEAEDVKLIIYTHLHHDHCGGARLFPHARHVVQRAEHRWAVSPDRFAHLPYARRDFTDAALSWLLAEGDWCILPGVHLLTTPGHTPGHQSVVLWDVPDCGTVIIAGDAVNCRHNVEQDTPPGIAADAAAATASIHRLVALAQASDAALLTSHDAEFFALLPKAPAPLGRIDEQQRRYYDHALATIYGEALDPDLVI